MPEGLGLRVLRTTGELEAMEPEWRALWMRDPAATPFQSPEWLLPWWRQFGQPELRAIAISANGELTGLLPFYIYREPQTGARQLLLMGAGTSDYLDGIFAPVCGVEAVRRGLALLKDHSGWDQAWFPQVRGESKLHQALAANERAFAPVQCSTDACSRMQAVPMAEWPRRIRQNVSYYRKRAGRSGELEFVVADRWNCESLFEALVRVHRERWGERGQAGVLSDARVLAWHREAVPRLAQSGLLRLCGLRLEGETIAVLYGLVDPPGRAQRSVYVYLPSFSPRYAEFSPGTLLLAQVIEQAARDGFESIDMLRGDEAYKRLWHMEKRPTFGFHLRNVAAQRLIEAA